MAINFCGQANVKYFMQKKLLRFCKVVAKVFFLSFLKINAKSTHFLPA